ncbi:MAG: hypothetical protein H0T60_09605, partial [Acidobacteria bacterium]|nr:hypothetical protein [Acidobacteriota bacterium]
YELSHLLGKDLGDSISLAQLSQYPDIQNDLLFKFLPAHLRPTFTVEDLETSLANILYYGYIHSQRQSNDRINQHDALDIPQNLNFNLMSGLSNEMIERLQRSQPQNFGQARQIPGMTPAALTLLLYQLKRAKAAL